MRITFNGNKTFFAKHYSILLPDGFTVIENGAGITEERSFVAFKSKPGVASADISMGDFSQVLIAFMASGDHVKGDGKSVPSNNVVPGMQAIAALLSSATGDKTEIHSYEHGSIKGAYIHQKSSVDCSNFQIQVGPFGHMYQFRVIINERMSDSEMLGIVNSWLDTMKRASKGGSDHSSVSSVKSSGSTRGKAKNAKAAPKGIKSLISKIKDEESLIREGWHSAYLEGKRSIDKHYRRNEWPPKSDYIYMHDIQREYGKKFSNLIEKFDSEADKIMTGNAKFDDVKAVVDMFNDLFWDLDDRLTLARKYYNYGDNDTTEDCKYYMPSTVNYIKSKWKNRYDAFPEAQLIKLEEQIDHAETMVNRAQNKLSECKEKYLTLGELEKKLAELRTEYTAKYDSAKAVKDKAEQAYKDGVERKNQAERELEALGVFAFGKKKQAKEKIAELEAEIKDLLDARNDANEKYDIVKTRMSADVGAAEAETDKICSDFSDAQKAVAEAEEKLETLKKQYDECKASLNHS